jgi:hypothetical protein
LANALIWINVLGLQHVIAEAMEWKPISSAPFDRDLELAVIDADGVHALVFACRRTLRGWVKAKNNQQVEVYPTHWRRWADAVSPAP